MATWADLEAAAPDIGAAGRRLLFHPGVGFGYLATVRRDGGPRLHPVNVVIAEDRLWSFLVPSPKLADLRRDGRFALHSTGAADVDDEFYVTGVAQAHDNAPGLRAAVEAALVTSVAPDHVLVELGLERALWAHYTTPPRWPPAYRTWRADRP